jgi:hypothetical protein
MYPASDLVVCLLDLPFLNCGGNQVRKVGGISGNARLIELLVVAFDAFELVDEWLALWSQILENP